MLYQRILEASTPLHAGPGRLLPYALFTSNKKGQHPKCPSTDEWIKKLWYIYTMEYYSAIKRNEIEPFVEKWMDLEIIILNEVSQTKTTII